MFEFTDLWVTIPPPFNMIVALALVGGFVAIVTTFATELRKYAVRRRELDFRRDMIDRGLEVDEIERLLGSGKSGRDRWNPSCWEEKS